MTYRLMIPKRITVAVRVLGVLQVSVPFVQPGTIDSVSLRPYGTVLRDRRVLAVLLLGVAIRIPATSGLVLTFYVVQTLHRNYAEAGFVATAFTLGAALGAPWRGRRVDQAGLRRALVASIVFETGCLAAAAYSSYWALLPLAFVAGVFTLPSFSVIRQSLAALVRDDLRRTAFSLDSIGVELSFMIGPALGVWMATTTSPRSAVLAVAALVFVAGSALWLFNPPTRSTAHHRAQPPSLVAPDLGRSESHEGPARPAGEHPARRPAKSRTSGWYSSALLVVLATSTGATIVLYGTDVSVFALLKALGHLEQTGLVFAFWGIGSITGALIYGQLRHPAHPLWLLVGLAVLTAPLALAGSVWAAAGFVTLAGGLCAPVITATADLVTRLVPETNRGAALGWHGSALTLGGAVGGPYAGAAIDAFGPAGGPVSVALAGAAIGVLGLLAHRAGVGRATLNSSALQG